MFTAPDWDAMVLVGRIVRPHGNRGQMMVAPETDFAETRFATGATVWCQRGGQTVPITVTECRFHDGRPIIGLTGVASINDAETFRGCELRVPDAALPALAAGQFWYHDLIGCHVVTMTGQDVGPVVRIDEGATYLLVVHGAGGEVLVPMVDRICRRIDVAGRTIEIESIPGLLELNVQKEKEETPARVPRVWKGGKRVDR
jgi:16S rRNA processing protein RimM